MYREDGLLGFDPATGSYGMDWFEGALTRPGQVIRDLVRTVHPQALQEAQVRGLAGGWQGAGRD